VLLPWGLYLSALLQSVHEAVESAVREFHLRHFREASKSKGAVLIGRIGGYLATKPAQGAKATCMLIPLELDQGQIQ
jgi:hypothetical protein